MTNPAETFDERYAAMIVQATANPLGSDAATTSIKNLETLSKCRPPQPEPEPIPDVVPTTRWGKFKCGAANVWDNETTRVVIKAGGAFAGVAAVVWSTVHRDHVIDKQAMSQANQRNS